jgi:hypothetical protein
LTHSGPAGFGLNGRDRQDQASECKGRFCAHFKRSLVVV